MSTKNRRHVDMYLIDNERRYYITHYKKYRYKMKNPKKYDYDYIEPVKGISNFNLKNILNYSKKQKKYNSLYRYHTYNQYNCCLY